MKQKFNFQYVKLRLFHSQLIARTSAFYPFVIKNVEYTFIKSILSFQPVAVLLKYFYIHLTHFQQL